MTPATPQDLHVIAGLLVAVLAVMMVVAKVGGKFLDDWWEKSRRNGAPQTDNANGDTKRVCIMAEGSAEHLAEAIDTTYDRLRDLIHQNHASVITILDRLASAAEHQVETQRSLAVTLALMAERLEHIEKRPRR